MSGDEFAHRSVVVTGAASGIGEATAEAFVRAGAHTLLIDLDHERLCRVRQRLTELEGAAEVSAVSLDVSDSDRVADALQKTAAARGGIHHLVNVAANFTAAGVHATRSEWARSLDVNVVATAMLTASASEWMPPGSSVVNIASISAHVAQADRWTYNATKAAVLALTRGQALDFATRGIRVNSVSPGWIWTAEVARAADGDRATWEPVWGKFHMLGRLGEPSEVADAVLFLSSNRASFITGTELMVDGGYSAMGPEATGETTKFSGTDARSSAPRHRV
ncbi:MAG: short-chain dehydrogenase [Candidatus Lumbricidophila eiseniae]|uniref:Short-chain dehydrogenase n=1 Tax=Candidatus Lumbricidiphila eiseniae TaxID=1969409 RepID=A0A2A6FPB3_9MICO|nr:MAG: short-chain dehydrogenase [Candidatus Lumbricidophila eiseniae]